MRVFEEFLGILGVHTSMLLFMMPIWFAFVVGWLWRPNWWQNIDKKKIDSFVSKFVDFYVPSSPSKGFSSIQNLTCFNMKFTSCDGQSMGDVGVKSTIGDASCSSSRGKNMDHPLVNDDDLVHLYRLVEVKDGGLPWIQMMDKSTPTMSYKAWRRDPETGPPQYRSSSIFEDATPEIVKDFFWDDGFRSKWDTMLIHSHTIEECRTTGTMIVQWVRKFPFFCSDREYIIGRRIWQTGRTFYCVTKGVPCSSIPRHDKPRRVDLYYSSWCIRPVVSERTGQMTACEVLLFHHEDMGIPWEIAKLGVRQGMWGAVKKIDPGLRAYLKLKATDAPLSGSAITAQITTKVSPQRLISLASDDNQLVTVTEEAVAEEKKARMNIPKLLVFSGAAVLACSLDRGLLTKAVIFGVARKLGRMGGKL